MEVRNLEGWTVYINRDMPRQYPEPTAKALEHLRWKLYQIKLAAYGHTDLAADICRQDHRQRDQERDQRTLRLRLRQGLGRPGLLHEQHAGHHDAGRACEKAQAEAARSAARQSRQWRRTAQRIITPPNSDVLLNEIDSSPSWRSPRFLRVASQPRGGRTARLLAQIEPRIKAIYERDEFAIRSFTATWLPDGSGYLKLETPAGASAAEVARYDAASGKRTVVVPSEKLVVPGSSRPLKLRWFQRAPSGNRFLLHGDITEGERRSGHWLYEPESGALRPVDDGPGLWFDANAFSPDGQRLLATRGADLIVFDIASGRTIPLTKDGDPGTIENGHRASWSPDGQWIAYIQSDSSAVPKRAVLVPGDPTYRTFRETTI